MLIAAIVLGGAADLNAQSKALKKDVTKRAKELKKEGWTMSAGMETIDYALLKYRTYLEENPERIAIQGVAQSNIAQNGRMAAQASGVTEYCSRVNSQVMGKIKNVLSTMNTNSTNIDEVNKFGAAFEASINQKVNGLVKHHFLLKRQANGYTEYNAYMSLDESAYREALKKAAEEAKRQAALGELSDEVNEFIENSVVTME